MRGFDLENMPASRPNIEGTADAAVGANGLGPSGSLLPHCRLNLGYSHDRTEASHGFNPFYGIDHLVQSLARKIGEVARLSQHRFFHQRIARTHRYAMAA